MPFEPAPKPIAPPKVLPTNPRKRLAALIREGVTMNPGSARIFWSHDGGPCCAVGAAAAALGYTDELRGTRFGPCVYTFMERQGISTRLLDSVSYWHTCGLSREKCADRLERRWWQFWR